MSFSDRLWTPDLDQHASWCVAIESPFASYWPWGFQNFLTSFTQIVVDFVHVLARRQIKSDVISIPTGSWSIGSAKPGNWIADNHLQSTAVFKDCKAVLAAHFNEPKSKIMDKKVSRCWHIRNMQIEVIEAHLISPKKLASKWV